VLVSLLCLQDCLDCLHRLSGGVLCRHSCVGSSCQIDGIRNLALHIALYFGELNSVLRDSVNLDNNRSLAVVYSFFILAYVQRGLQIIERVVHGPRLEAYESDRYFAFPLALFGATEKEDTLVGGRGMSKIKPFAHRR